MGGAIVAGGKSRQYIIRVTAVRPIGTKAMFDDSDEEGHMNSTDAAAEITSASKYKTTVLSGQATLKALLILNGAGAIAFLGFMGTAIQRIQMSPNVLDHFIAALWGFILGAFAAVLSSGAIFLTNCFSYVDWPKISYAFFFVTCLAGLAAFVGFIYGGVEATEGFRQAAGTLASAPCAPK